MTAPRQAPWWERVVDGARQVVELAAQHAEAAAPAESRARPELAPGAAPPASKAAPIEAELVDEAPCTVTRGCTRRHGHPPPCAPEGR